MIAEPLPSGSVDDEQRRLENLSKQKERLLESLRQEIARFRMLENVSGWGYYILMIVSVALGAITGALAATEVDSTIKLVFGVATSIAAALNALIPAKQNFQRRARTRTRLAQIADELGINAAAARTSTELAAALVAAQSSRIQVEDAEQQEWNQLLQQARADGK